MHYNYGTAQLLEGKSLAGKAQESFIAARRRFNWGIYQGCLTAAGVHSMQHKH